MRELFRRRPRIAAERDEEFAFHIEMETAENVRRGMTEAEARRAAMLRFGGRQRYREETHDAHGIVAIGTMAGLALAFSTTRLMRALLYEVKPDSTATFAVATTVLIAVTLAATLVPAHRAARTHLAVVLRSE